MTDFANAASFLRRAADSSGCFFQHSFFGMVTGSVLFHANTYAIQSPGRHNALQSKLVVMNWSAVGAILMGLAVGFGAFGAHGLKGRLDDYSMGVYEKAVLYHFFHALGLLIVSILSRIGAITEYAGTWVCWLLSGGYSAVFGQPLCARAQRSKSLRRRHAIWRSGLSRRLVFAGILADSKYPGTLIAVSTSPCQASQAATENPARLSYIQPTPPQARICRIDGPDQVRARRPCPPADLPSLQPRDRYLHDSALLSHLYPRYVPAGDPPGSISASRPPHLPAARVLP